MECVCLWIKPTERQNEKDFWLYKINKYLQI